MKPLVCYYCRTPREILYSITYKTDSGMLSFAVCEPSGCPHASHPKY